MTPQKFHGGARSAYAYRITQPLVAFHYFWTFFFPGGLTADTDLASIPSIWKGGAWAGFVFIGALISIAAAAGKRQGRPIAFGIGWFLVTPLIALIVAAALVSWRLFLAAGVRRRSIQMVDDSIASEAFVFLDDESEGWLAIWLSRAGIRILPGFPCFWPLPPGSPLSL